MFSYVKDNGKYLKPVNMAGAFGSKVDDLTLQLINSCKYVYQDGEGDYVYDATSFDEQQNVYFTKRYL